MGLKTLRWLWLLTLLLFAPALSFAVGLDEYKHAADGVVVGIGRGITLFDKELESARTEEISIGIQFTDILRFSVPFGSYEVDTQGHAEDRLPIGTIDVKTVGLAVTLGIPGRWSPFIGVGGNFYAFDEQFGTPANLQNTFGAQGYGGLRIRLIEQIFDIAQLHGSIAYQFSFLEPDISVPNRPEIENISLNQHSITVGLELTGL